MKNEIWKDIPGYEGCYQVSNLGNIKSLKRTVNTLFGRPKVQDEFIFLKENLKGGYLGVNLSNNGSVKKMKIHRLVAMAFISNPENKKCVNHIDGNKQNNHIENLEWVTYKENSVHASNIGLSSTYWSGKGGKGYFANMKINQYDLNMNFIKTHDSATLASKEVGIDKSCIIRAANGKIKQSKGFRWKYVN